MTAETIEKRGGEAASRVTTFIVHLGGETRVIKGSEHEEVIVIVERAGYRQLEEAVFVFLGESTSALVEAIEIEDGEDDHEPVGHHEKPTHHGHGGGIVHIHCHKCRRVKTGVTYNGADKHHKFSPAATIETVRRWAVKKFKISAVDAEKLFLWVSGAEQPLDGTKHVGDMVHAPGCNLELLLLPDPRVNG